MAKSVAHVRQKTQSFHLSYEMAGYRCALISKVRSQVLTMNKNARCVMHLVRKTQTVLYGLISLGARKY